MIEILTGCVLRLLPTERLEPLRCCERTEEGELLLSVMLKQEEGAFIKALTSIELTPVLLRELRKAMAAGKKRKFVAATGANAASASALERAN